ncbi:MAG TPA: MFS transporter [Spirochaetia bacterium]|nr:MFS transporter [Spirochaetia bacterium]
MQPASRRVRKRSGSFNKKGALGLIFVIMLMDIIGITILNPVAPYLVRRYDERALMVTMITIIYAVGQFVAAPLMGKLGDRLGRRPVLLVSIAGQGAGYLIFALGGSLWVLLAARLVGGITGGNLSTAAAYIADVSAPQERSKNFAMIGTAWSLGLILGPAAGGLMGTLALEAPAYIAAVLSFVNVGLGFFLLQESLPRERRETTPLRGADLNPIVAIVDMGRKPGLGWLLIVMSLFNFAFNGINAVGVLFVIDKFHAATWQVSVMLMLGGGTIAVCNSLLVPRWVPRFGERVTGAVSLLGMAVFDVAIFLVPLLWLVILISMAVSAMSSFTFPTLTTLSTDRVGHSEVGLLLGVTTAIGSLMNILGPLWAGAIYDHVMVGSPYWMGAAVFVTAGLMLLRPATIDRGGRKLYRPVTER